VSSAADERLIQMVGLAVDRFFDRCENTVLHTDHSLLCWLRSQYFGKAYKAPFELSGRNATRKRYRGLCKKMIFFCIRAHLMRAQDVDGVAWGIPFSANAWVAIQNLWKVVSEGLRVPLDDRPEQRRLRGRSSAVTTRKEGTGAVSEGTEDHDLTLAEFASAPDNDEYVEADDLDESGSDSDESDDEYIHLSDIGSVEGSPATQLSRHVDFDEDGAVSQPQNGRRTVTTSSAAIPPPNDILLDSVAGLCAFICKEPFHDGKSATTIMVYFAGVLGTGQDGVTFERPRNYTSKLSAIVHSARLCLLEATLPRIPHSNLNWGPRPSLGQDIVMNQMREAFLCQGSSAPVSELLSLRAYGRVLARTDGSTFRVEWTDDGSSVKWEDGSLTMTQFRALGHHAIRLAEGTIDALVGKYRPGLNLSLLQDRISEHRRGYSFVQEPKNDISSAYLDLANKIGADPERGLMTRNGWNMRSVRQFLRKEEILLEQIMLIMYLRGGQAPRTTEFFSLRCWNGASTSR